MATTPAINFDDPDWDRPFRAQQISMLTELAEDGMELARDLKAQVKAAKDEKARERTYRLWLRMERAVAMTLHLRDRLIDAIKNPRPPAEPPAVTERKAALERTIRRAAQGAGWYPDRIARLSAGRFEAEFLGDIEKLPFSEALAKVAGDMDLPLNWPQLAQDAWAQAEIASGNPGAPLRALSPSRSAHAVLGSLPSTRDPPCAPSPPSPPPS